MMTSFGLLDGCPLIFTPSANFAHDRNMPRQFVLLTASFYIQHANYGLTVFSPEDIKFPHACFLHS